MRALLLAGLLAAPLAARAAPATDPGPYAAVAPHQCVVVLHGMARSKVYMRLIEADLERAGYAVVNESYPTRKESIEQISQRVDGYVQRCRDGGATRIHFVAHSLGGLVVRYWLSTHAMPDAGRFVMLGTPNRGSEVADYYMRSRWYRFTTGPAGMEIGTGPDGIPSRLGPPPIESAVIAGSRAASPALSRRFGGPNDGKVSVASTQMPGLADFLVVDNSHYFLTRSSVVLRQIRAFLATGKFAR